jgi:hypothetical protein
MSTFEFTTEKANQGRPVVVERTSPGPALRLRADSVLSLGSDPANELPVAIMPREYGTVLARALFRHQLRDTKGRGITTCRLRTICLTNTNQVVRRLRPSMHLASSGTKLKVRALELLVRE